MTESKGETSLDDNKILMPLGVFKSTSKGKSKKNNDKPTALAGIKKHCGKVPT